MKRSEIFLIAIVVLSVILSCSSVETIADTGEIIYLDFEGGFYGIIGDHGGHYEPINLPSEYKVNGLRVSFRAKIRDDLGSYHMWGTIIELTYIASL